MTFSMVVNRVVYVTGRGTIVVGTVEGDLVHGPVVVRQDRGDVETAITSVERFRHAFDCDKSCPCFRRVGLVLRGVKPEDIDVGAVVMGDRSAANV